MMLAKAERGPPTEVKPRHFLFLVLPRFNMMSFTSAIEPLRSANSLSGKQLYTWSVGWTEKVPVVASNGITVMPDFALSEAPRVDGVFVCASFDVHGYRDSRTFNYLRRVDREGGILGSIGVGTLILARAGVLDGHRATIHWENRPAFSEEFPELEVTDHLYEIDRRRATCSGGAAALDMMLHVIAADHGGDLAVAISGQLLHDRMRTPLDHQRMADRLRLARASPHISRAIMIMESNIEQPLTIPEISDQIGLAQRQLERLFRKYCGKTPYQYYLDIRLHRSRALLLESGLSILNVALATGFTSQTHFTDRFRLRYGMTPSGLRQRSLSESMAASGTPV